MTVGRTGGSMPPWTLAVAAMCSIQLSSALAVPLIDTVGAFGTLMAIEPAIGVLLGLVVLHQQPSLIQIVGITLVVLAGAAAQRGGSRPAPPVTEAIPAQENRVHRTQRLPPHPLTGDRVDQPAYTRLVHRLAHAGVDSITALGSTGSYAYLSREERRTVARLAVEHAGTTPVIVGIGALRTSHVLQHADDAQAAGAAGLLLPAMSYQRLTDDDVYGLFDDVTRQVNLPVIVYDNPGTTHVTFNNGLYQAIAALPNIASIKIPGVPTDPAEATARIDHLRTILPAHVTIGVSGDSDAATGLNAGCDAWYSVIAGTLPTPALTLTRAAQAGDADQAVQLSADLQPLWDLFARHGSLRVTAAIAEHLGLAQPSSLPTPIRGLDAAARADVAEVVDQLHLT